jgi:transposase
MNKGNDIVLAVDYHDENSVIRWFDCATGEERVLKCVTEGEAILAVVRSAKKQAELSGGQAVWIMESTTGWARVKRLVAPLAKFVLANVVQMPLPPKARRKKTDKVDTKRLLREYLGGLLPVSFQPERWLRELRRLVGSRESLVSRRTAVRNWINRYLAHETWLLRAGLWSQRGLARLRELAKTLEGLDGVTLKIKLEELEALEERLGRVEKEMLKVYRSWPMAQWLDEIDGIGPIAAVSILARIGPVERFADAEELIAYAGLAPGLQESDQHRRNGKVGGGGTDKHLRHYLMEASVWARRVPRYQGTYERVRSKRGKKIGRLVVARMVLRSIYKMLRDEVRFSASSAA